jgi:alpha-mannosidase
MGIARCAPSAKPLENVFAKGNALENKYYRIEIDPVSGGIACLMDKRTGRQWAGRDSLNALLYISDGVPIHASCFSIEVAESGPVTAALKITSACTRCGVETLIRLNAVNDRIDIENRLHKEPSEEPLNLYFSFPFAVQKPSYHYEGAAAILRPGTLERGGDMLPGAGQEIYAAQDFVDVNEDGAGALLCPLDNHLFQFGGNGYELMPEGPLEDGPAVLALCLTNHAYKEILRDQCGNADFLFRFALKTYAGKFDENIAVRFGREASNPLMAIRPGAELTKFSGRTIVESLTPGVFVTALKPSEEVGGAVVLRFWNVYEKEAQATFDVSALGMLHAETVDLLERRAGASMPFDGKTLSAPVRGRGFGAILLYK